MTDLTVTVTVTVETKAYPGMGARCGHKNLTFKLKGDKGTLLDAVVEVDVVDMLKGARCCDLHPFVVALLFAVFDTCV